MKHLKKEKWVKQTGKKANWRKNIKEDEKLKKNS